MDRQSLLGVPCRLDSEAHQHNLFRYGYEYHAIIIDAIKAPCEDPEAIKTIGPWLDAGQVFAQISSSSNEPFCFVLLITQHRHARYQMAVVPYRWITKQGPQMGVNQMLTHSDRMVRQAGKMLYELTEKQVYKPVHRWWSRFCFWQKLEDNSSDVHIDQRAQKH